MDKETLEKFYWPITVDSYTDEYYNLMLNPINESFKSQSFDWYIGCIKGFVFNDFEQEVKDSLINSFGLANPEFHIVENEAHLMILSQAIIYNLIFNGDDKLLSSKLSLALNTMMFCYNPSIYRLPNAHFVDEMQAIFRNHCIERDLKNKKDFERVGFDTLKNNPSFEPTTINQVFPAIFQKIDTLRLYNEIMHWLIFCKSLKTDMDYKTMNRVDAAFNIGIDLASIASSEPLVYPEAYIMKVIINMGREKSFINEKKSLGYYIEETSIDFFDEELTKSTICPLSFAIMHKIKTKNNIDSLMDLSKEITLFDLAVQVYYESILTNLLN